MVLRPSLVLRLVYSLVYSVSRSYNTAVRSGCCSELPAVVLCVALFQPGMAMSSFPRPCCPQGSVVGGKSQRSTISGTSASLPPRQDVRKTTGSRKFSAGPATTEPPIPIAYKKHTHTQTHIHIKHTHQTLQARLTRTRLSPTAISCGTIAQQLLKDEVPRPSSSHGAVEERRGCYNNKWGCGSSSSSSKADRPSLGRGGRVGGAFFGELGR